MRKMDDQLKAAAEGKRVVFTQERHARLLSNLRDASARPAERPLRRPVDVRLAGVLGIVVLTACSAWWIGGRQPDKPEPRFAAPVLLAERSILSAQSFAERLPTHRSQQIAEPSVEVVRFLADQISLARSLAPAQAPKTPA